MNQNCVFWVQQTLVFAVQCKHPDQPSYRRKPRSLGRPTVQQVYGAAKGFDFKGAIAITSASHSRDAKIFSELKPNEIMLYNRDDLFRWISNYQWNSGELVKSEFK